MAKNIMIQGTMSNAGKSLLGSGAVPRTAAGRPAGGSLQEPEHGPQLLHHRRWRRDGPAQVVQAEAAGIAPDVRMNPILLKPTTDRGSQVIVGGRALGNMDAAAYYRRKKEFIPAVLEAYESLAAEYDVIVIEGAEALRRSTSRPTTS